MDGAEVYLLMIRKSGLPILGEAMAPPFNMQVEVLDWNWKIVNQEEVEKRKKNDSEFESEAESAGKSDREMKVELDVLAADIKAGMKDATAKELDVATRRIQDLVLSRSNSTDPKVIRATMQEIAKIQKEAADKSGESASESTEEQMTAYQNKKKYEEQKKRREQNNLEFSFSKRVDFASTQMLNCMKSGEILPQVIISIFHRSVSAPLTIIVTAKNLRFLKYDLSVEVDDTMADMKEDWEAEFSDISFSYTNTRGVDQQKGRLGVDALAGAKLARAAAQTSRLFVMTSKD